MIRSRSHHQGLTQLYDWHRQLKTAPGTDLLNRARMDIAARITKMESNFQIIGWSYERTEAT